MPLILQSSYTGPKVLSNPHLATVVPHLIRWKVRGLRYERERIDTPDDDFLDIDWSRIGSKHLVIANHGLAGSSRGIYILGMVRALNQAGFDVVAPNQRSCSGEPNRKIHFFTGGDSGDVETVVHHALAKYGYETVSLVGFSMGGNISLLYAGHHAESLPPQVRRCVTFSVPLHMEATADHLTHNTLKLYMKRFLAGYKEKMRAKAKLMPGVFDLEKLESIRTFREFDETFNIRWLGFPDVESFYTQISSLYALEKIRIPTLIVQAKDDPFLPPECYPTEIAERHPNVWLEMPEMGGHVGFYSMGGVWSEQRAVAWLREGLFD